MRASLMLLIIIEPAIPTTFLRLGSPVLGRIVPMFPFTSLCTHPTPASIVARNALLAMGKYRAPNPTFLTPLINVAMLLPVSAMPAFFVSPMLDVVPRLFALVNPISPLLVVVVTSLLMAPMFLHIVAVLVLRHMAMLKLLMGPVMIEMRTLPL